MRILRVAAAIALLALTAAGLLEFAQWQFTAHLRNEGVRNLALAASGGTPWEWDFHSDNIVAGRVFGDAQADFADDCLLVTSRGAPFEIGLRLTRILPPRDFPRLRLFAFADKPAQAQIVVRERLDGGEWTSAPFFLAGTSTPTNIDIDKIQWRNPNGKPEDMPVGAAMLRLRFRLPQDATLQFNGATLERPANFERLDLSQKVAVMEPGAPSRAMVIPVYRVPRAEFDAAQIAAIAKSNSPILALPQTQRMERQRLMLDAIHDVLPAAIVLPQNALDATFAQARAQPALSSATKTSAALRWIALIAFAAALLKTRLFPPRNRRFRAALEIASAFAGPLWLIVGGRFTGEFDAAQYFLIACIAAYAITLGFPRDWTWNGSARAWRLAATVVALAAGIGLLGHFSDGAPIRAIGSAHVLRYFGWALIQQYLVCVVCTSRWKLVTGSNFIAAWLGASGFALLHAPNADLMLATFAGGLCWCALYLRERALLPLALSHAASALFLIALLPKTWLYSAEVSARFFQ